MTATGFSFIAFLLIPAAWPVEWEEGERSVGKEGGSGGVKGGPGV